jgi:hypothetical protein
VAKRLILEGDDVDWVVLSYAITAFWAHDLFHGYHERQVVIVVCVCVWAPYTWDKKFRKFGCVSMPDVRVK